MFIRISLACQAARCHVRAFDGRDALANTPSVVSRGPVQAGSAADATRRSTRDAVLEAALAVFTEHTYNGTAMPLVAERAGAAVGTIYRHFPSKQALVNAVFQHWKRLLLEYLARGARPGEPVRAEFGRLWSALRAF